MAVSAKESRSWPDYPAVWRWHFYAGLFCVPFFCWLAVTGSLYLFRPDIEAWIDRPYESLSLDGPRAAPSSEVRAAIAALPGSTFRRYELPATATGAAQVILNRDGIPYRVHVHPGTLRVLHQEREDLRLMDVVAHLHGNLLLGTGGSVLVELAGSWGVILLLTGLFLWIPRGGFKAAGLLYPRLQQRGRVFWRDLHSVTGLWVSMVTLFLLLSGLPWSVNWGNYLTWVRNHWVATAGTPDWPIGGREPAAAGAVIKPTSIHAGMPDMESDGTIHPGSPRARTDGDDDRILAELDKMVPVALALHAPLPVWVSPPSFDRGDWVVASRTQNRPLRVTYTVAPASGVVTGIDDFAHKNIVDRAVNVMIALHEGQMFGRINQAVLLVTATGVLMVSISAAVMWWKRRPARSFGAPPAGVPPHFSVLVLFSSIALTLLLPLFGLSLLLVLAADLWILRRFPSVRRWLGSAPRAA